MPKRRQRESAAIDALFDFLSSAPVWAGPVLVVLAYAMSRWFFPWLLTAVMKGNKFGEGMSQPLIMFAERGAPYFAGGVLVIWVIAELKKRANRRRFERQSGSASINEMHWRDFESLLCEAFRRQGFIVERRGKAGPDGGIDIRLSKAGAVTLVQCKHWKRQQVGVQVVRELLGVVTSEGAQSGIVVTSGQFSPDAAEFAARNPIRLIEGRELLRMIGEAQKSGRIKSATMPVATPGSPESVGEIAATTDPVCPKCGAPMARRTARRGPNAGSEFFGCSRYPECRGIRALTT